MSKATLWKELKQAQADTGMPTSLRYNQATSQQIKNEIAEILFSHELQGFNIAHEPRIRQQTRSNRTDAALQNYRVSGEPIPHWNTHIVERPNSKSKIGDDIVKEIKLNPHESFLITIFNRVEGIEDQFVVKSDSKKSYIYSKLYHSVAIPYEC